MNRYEIVCLIAAIVNLTLYMAAGVMVGLSGWDWLIYLPLVALASLNGGHVIAYLTVGAESKEVRAFRARFGKK